MRACARGSAKPVMDVARLANLWRAAAVQSHTAGGHSAPHSTTVGGISSAPPAPSEQAYKEALSAYLMQVQIKCSRESASIFNSAGTGPTHSEPLPPAPSATDSAVDARSSTGRPASTPQDQTQQADQTRESKGAHGGPVDGPSAQRTRVGDDGVDLQGGYALLPVHWLSVDGSPCPVKA